MPNIIDSGVADLVLSFDCDTGLPEEVYDATYSIILCTYGKNVVERFIQEIDATDGVFYAKNSDNLRSFIRDCIHN